MDGQQYPRDRVGEEREHFDGVSPQRVGLGGAGQGCRGCRSAGEGMTVFLGARLGSGERRSSIRGRTIIDVGTSSQGGSSRKCALEGEEVRRFRPLLMLRQVRIGV